MNIEQNTARAANHNPIRDRDMPLIFDSHTPRHVLVSAIRQYNERFKALPGIGYFTELPERRVMYGERVHVSELYADDAAWHAYKAMYVDREPLMDAGFEFEPDPQETVDPLRLLSSARA